MTKVNRRQLLITGAASGAVLATPALAQSIGAPDTFIPENDVTSATRRNTSSFQSKRWQPYFNNLANGAILVDITSRALHLWEASGTYHLYPSSVPMNEQLTRRGRTRITRKVEGPTWRPTPSMKKRNPEWPDFIPAGPENPLGTHALYLSWTYYRIHGTHDTRKIGRQSSNGCIGLYNQHIAEVFGMAKVGTQVLLI